MNGVDSISEIPKNRWDWQALYGDPKTEPGKTNIKWGGFIDGVDEFDPLFFNIAPKEAEYMDPQHRLFLQATWHAMEDAGYSSTMLAGKKVGVYAGVSKNDYAELMREQHEEIMPYVSTGTVHSILANRVSYLLDLHGPSESMDTACSSSLVALRSALNDIRSGECHMAFVGGVNALLSPTMYLSHSRSGFLSEDGRCKSFDARANGYVRGEGVAVLLLKPLREAINDGDAIHAVIRSAAVNHGGKSSGLTAPSITAQAEVISKALEEANMDPNHITYIEVHGTGTPLGDPIEIEGLKLAYSAVTQKNPGIQNCLLGAVKTNIGHTESVSGMAGLIKTILAMKHHTIPANLHFQSINPKISLENSPFRLATQSESWIPKDSAGQVMRRRGGISSFGMGGSNAHVIIEEPPERHQQVHMTGPVLIPISAKKGRLIAAVTALDQYLGLQKDPIDLAALAFTLQTGRDHFEQRVAFIVDSIATLSTRLQQFLANETQEGIYLAQTKNKDQHSNESKLNLPEAARFWVEGGTIDWFLYWNELPIRMQGLPGYPFKPKRCWFVGATSVPAPINNSPKTGAAQIMKSFLATSVDFVIKSDEAFLKDHIIAGQSIMPGVMYLELARMAAEQLHSRQVKAITHISWISPIKVISEDIKVNITFKDDHLNEFEIMEGGELRATGSLVYDAIEHPKPINLQQIREQCPHKFDSQTIYSKMKIQGLNQGPSLHVLSEFCSGSNIALAKLHLSSNDSINDYLLHPSLMDGVFQTVVAHHFSEHENHQQQYLPTMLESVAWFKPLEQEAYAYVEELPAAGSGQLLKYRMSLVNVSGEVIVQFEGFNRRPLKPTISNSVKPIAAIKPDDFYYREYWAEQPAITNRSIGNHILIFSEDEAIKPDLASRLDGQQTIIGVKKGLFYKKHHETLYEINPASPDDFNSLFDELKSQKISINELVYMWELIDVKTILYLTQSILQSHCFVNLLILYIYKASSSYKDAEHAMNAGFGRTLVYENPSVEWRTIETTTESSVDLANIIASELKSAHTSPLLEVSYATGKRTVRRVEAARDVCEFVPTNSIFKMKGVYLITGGAGGLGQIIANHLATHYQAHLILVGRSELNDSIQKVINDLASRASSVRYLSADVTQGSSLAKVFATLPEELRQIHGVLHAAGIKQDSFIIKKDPNSLNQVISTKVRGAYLLDELTKNIPLDFMLLFSSIAALIPNQGQSDYATANSFLDKFSMERNELLRKGLRQGVTLAINLPLWASGGMKVTEEQEDYLLEEFGMTPLPTEQGIKAIEHLLAYAQAEPLKYNQLIVIDGDKTKIQAAFDGVKPTHTIQVEEKNTTPAQQTEDDSDDMELYLKDIIAQILHISVDELDSSMDFEIYGINSIVITEINTALSKRFPGLPKTLFFEYPNLNELLTYFKTRVKPNENLASPTPKPTPVEATQTPVHQMNTLDCALGDSHEIDSFDNDLIIKLFKASSAYLSGFSYQGKPAIPGAFFLEMARQGASALHPEQKYVSIINNYWPIALENGNEEVLVHAKFLKNTEPLEFEIASIGANQQEIIHATGALAKEHKHQKPEPINLFERISAAQQILDSESFYNTIHNNADLRLAGVFRPVESLYLLEREAVASLVLANPEQFAAERFVINPVLFTGLEQSLLVITALTHAHFYPQGVRLMPVSIDSVDLYDVFPSRCFVHIKAIKEPSPSNKTQIFDMVVYDESGNIIASIAGNSMRILGL